MDRGLAEKQIKRLLQYVPDCALATLLWVVQQFAAEGLNSKRA